MQLAGGVAGKRKLRIYVWLVVVVGDLGSRGDPDKWAKQNGA